MTAHVSHVVSGSLYQLRQLRSVYGVVYHAMPVGLLLQRSSQVGWTIAMPPCMVWVQVTYTGYKL